MDKKIMCAKKCGKDITDERRWYLYPLHLEGDPREGGMVCLKCARERHPDLSESTG